jgi:hypothetical protein
MEKINSLQEKMWGKCPLVKYLLGRKKINALIDSAIAVAPVAQFEIARKSPACVELTCSKWVIATREHHAKDATFGPLFWLLVLPLLQVLIRRMLDWWIDSRDNRESFAEWKKHE